MTWRRWRETGKIGKTWVENLRSGNPAPRAIVAWSIMRNGEKLRSCETPIDRRTFAPMPSAFSGAVKIFSIPRETDMTLLLLTSSRLMYYRIFASWLFVAASRYAGFRLKLFSCYLYGKFSCCINRGTDWVYIEIMNMFFRKRSKKRFKEASMAWIYSWYERNKMLLSWWASCCISLQSRMI